MILLKKHFPDATKKISLDGLKQYSDEEFNEIYETFRKIKTGEIYQELGLVIDNNIKTFINSIKEQSQSFRSYIIELCRKNFKELNKDGYYKLKFYNLYRG